MRFLNLCKFFFNIYGFNTEVSSRDLVGLSCWVSLKLFLWMDAWVGWLCFLVGFSFWVSLSIDAIASCMIIIYCFVVLSHFVKVKSALAPNVYFNETNTNLSQRAYNACEFSGS
jgi:hypothetical protein